MPDIPRGIRNNNPGNIRRGPVPWVGMAPEQTDPEYVQFVDAAHGIRAIVRILHVYAARGQTTIRQIITRWAPATENDTAAYIVDVASRVGLDPDAPVDAAHFPDLVAAIIHHENGVEPYDMDLIRQAIALA